MTGNHAGSRARIVFLIRVPLERTEEFIDAYQKIRYEVANGVPGHIIDQVCRSPADPEQWLITSEWDSLAAFEEWERSPGHRLLVRPMRDCMSEARSIRFTVVLQTSSGDLTEPAELAAVRGD
ncbi:MAG: antibiotic biosynthesis monooxygenase [Kutzneria sp.]|nr:antibiotic biosynthesis monooxygenase [Kutzneria sp.]